jgi:hypothetical protein
MNLALRVIAATGMMVLMPAGGAAVGSYLGFHAVGVPSGPHCGLAVLPALMTGGIGGFIGFFSGLIPAAVLAAGIITLARPAKAREER